MTNERMRFYAAGPGQPMIAVCTPYDKKPASVGNGMMVALAAGSKEAVHKIHEKPSQRSPNPHDSRRR